MCRGLTFIGVKSVVAFTALSVMVGALVMFVLSVVVSRDLLGRSVVGGMVGLAVPRVDLRRFVMFCRKMLLVVVFMFVVVVCWGQRIIRYDVGYAFSNLSQEEFNVRRLQSTQLILGEAEFMAYANKWHEHPSGYWSRWGAEGGYWVSYIDKLNGTWVVSGLSGEEFLARFVDAKAVAEGMGLSGELQLEFIRWYILGNVFIEEYIARWGQEGREFLRGPWASGRHSKEVFEERVAVYYANKGKHIDLFPERIVLSAFYDIYYVYGDQYVSSFVGSRWSWDEYVARVREVLGTARFRDDARTDSRVY